MMKFITFLTLLVGVTCSDVGLAQADPQVEQFLDSTNRIGNPGFEYGLSGWKATGSSTKSLTTTASQVAFGTSAATWTAGAAGDKWTSNPLVIPTGLYNRLCFVSMYYTGGDSNIKMQAVDGGGVLIPGSDVTLEAVSGNTRPSGQSTFICPSSGSISFQTESTAAAASLHMDAAFVGTTMPQVGSVKTDWKNYTPGFSQLDFTDVSVKYRRSGQDIEIKGTVEVSGLTGQSSNNLYIDLPTGLIFDPTLIEAAKFKSSGQLGSGLIFDSSVPNTITPFFDLSDSFGLHKGVSAIGTTAIRGTDLAIGDILNFSFTAPIDGWSGTSLVFQPTVDDLPFTTWKTYTPGGVPSAITGSVAAANYKRNFDSIDMVIRIDINAAVSGTITYVPTDYLPPGLTYDTSKNIGGGIQTKGQWQIFDSSASSNSNQYYGEVAYGSTGGASVGIPGNPDLANATNPITFASGDRLVFTLTNIPIVEYANAPTLPPIGVEVASETNAGLMEAGFSKTGTIPLVFADFTDVIGTLSGSATGTIFYSLVGNSLTFRVSLTNHSINIWTGRFPVSKIEDALGVALDRFKDNGGVIRTGNLTYYAGSTFFTGTNVTLEKTGSSSTSSTFEWSPVTTIVN